MFGAILGIGASLIGADSSSSAASSAAAGSNALSEQQAADARDLQNFWDQQYKPLEAGLISSTEKGLKPNYAGVTGRASADVLQSFSKARGINDRNLERMGINPNSGAYADENRIQNVDQAAADANAINAARTAERNRVNNTNFSRLYDLASIGRGLPGTAQSGLSSAASGLARSAQMYGQSAYNTSRAIGGLPWNQIGSSIGNYFSGSPSVGTEASFMPSGSNVNSSWQPSSSGNDMIVQYAHGGEVKVNRGLGLRMIVGGDGTVDSVPGVAVGADGAASPVALSEGELVIPKPVVDAKGTEFFQRLIDKYDPGAREAHTPGRGLPRLEHN